MLALLVFALSCSDRGIDAPEGGALGELGKVTLSFSNPPPEITHVIARISRQGHTTRVLELTISDTTQSATGSFTEVVIGLWHLRVEALDDSGVVRYAGEADVNVLSGQVAHVSLHLSPTSGTIEIEVTWGSRLVWQKYPGNPVISSTAGGGYYSLSPSVSFNSATNQYRMWFTSYNGTWRISMATSSDGTTWTPHFGNPVLVGDGGVFESNGVAYADVVSVNDSLRMYYTAIDATGGSAISLAISADGIHWSKYSGNPLLTRQAGTWESTNMHDPKVYFDGLAYTMFYVGYDGNRARTGMATSVDGITWTRNSSNPILQEGPPGSWDQGAALLNSFVFHDGKFYVFYEGSFPISTLVGLATSTDGVTWTKYPGNPVFVGGSPGSWDSRIYIGSMRIRNDQLQYWYSGHGSSGGWQIGYATSQFIVLAGSSVQGESPKQEINH